MRRTITESQLKNIVAKSVKKVLNEINYNTIASAANKMMGLGQYDRADNLQKNYGESTKMGNLIKIGYGNVYVMLNDSNSYYRYTKRDGVVVVEDKNMGYKPFNFFRYNDRELIVRLVSALRNTFPDAENIDQINKNAFIS